MSRNEFLARRAASHRTDCVRAVYVAEQYNRATLGTTSADARWFIDTIADFSAHTTQSIANLFIWTMTR